MVDLKLLLLGRVEFLAIEGDAEGGGIPDFEGEIVLRFEFDLNLRGEVNENLELEGGFSWPVLVVLVVGLLAPRLFGLGGIIFIRIEEL